MMRRSSEIQNPTLNELLDIDCHITILYYNLTELQDAKLNHVQKDVENVFCFEKSIFENDQLNTTDDFLHLF